jgi:uncharacterized cofD-like protein
MDSYFNDNLRPPAITCIGGGTGLSTMLRGLKRHTPNITAIVTVTDDGGGSGILRDELGMPPPGDIRNCILALSNIEPTMEKLMSYRFSSGSLEGQSFGNLLLAAMNGISESFDKAVARMGEVLAITGRVLPVTNEDIRLMAEFEDGSVIFGESKIYEAKKERSCRIKRIQVVPSPVAALPESLKAIHEADLLVLGPGSLYTSLIPNLLVGGIVRAIKNSKAKKLYISNIMTQPGETEGYTVSDHIKELFRHSSKKLFDMCLVNSLVMPYPLVRHYEEEGAAQLTVDAGEIEQLGVEVFSAPLAEHHNDLVRHDPERLAQEIMKIYRKKAPTRLFERPKAL